MKLSDILDCLRNNLVGREDGFSWLKIESESSELDVGYKKVCFVYSFFFSVLEFELSASCLLAGAFTTW
jgi:hypothetical protein